MILVTGATGTVGREVVKFLVERGEQVRAVTRNPDTAALPGAEVAGGDPSRPKTLTSALNGINAVFVVPRAVGDATAELLSLAAAQSAIASDWIAAYRHYVGPEPDNSPEWEDSERRVPFASDRGMVGDGNR